jgi:hypothetical protein
MIFQAGLTAFSEFKTGPYDEGGLELPEFRMSQTTPSMARAIRPTGISHMNIIPIQPKGVRGDEYPQLLIMPPGPIIVLGPIMPPPNRSKRKTMAILPTTNQLTFCIFSVPLWADPRRQLLSSSDQAVASGVSLCSSYNKPSLTISMEGGVIVSAA